MTKIICYKCQLLANADWDGDIEDPYFYNLEIFDQEVNVIHNYLFLGMHYGMCEKSWFMSHTSLSAEKILNRFMKLAAKLPEEKIKQVACHHTWEIDNG